MSEILQRGLRIIKGILQVNAVIDPASNIAEETGGNLAALVANGDPVYSQLLASDETLTNSINIDTGARRLIDIYASASTATTFTVDISMDNTNWVNHYTSSSVETTHITTEWNGFRYVKISAAAAGVSGTDTVTLIMGAK